MDSRCPRSGGEGVGLAGDTGGVSGTDVAKRPSVGVGALHWGPSDHAAAPMDIGIGDTNEEQRRSQHEDNPGPGGGAEPM
eukprot:7328979-Lingulodinium_polyedra.AAC.1